MAFQPCPGIASVEMVYGIYGEIAENVYHVHNTSTWTSSQMDSVAAAFRNIWETDWRPVSSPSTFQFKIIITDLTTATGLRNVYSYTTNNQGSGTGVGLPNNVTIAVKHGTGLRGRSSRGRSFWMGLQEDQVSGNTLNAATEASILVGYSALLGAVTALTGMTLVVLSRFSGVDPVTHKPIPRANGIGTTITGFSFVDGFVDSQRRRLPAHNRHH